MMPDPGLIDRLYQEEIARARRLSPAERLLEGPRLFDLACRVMQDGVRHERPDADPATVLDIVRARLEHLRRLETGA